MPTPTVTARIGEATTAHRRGFQAFRLLGRFVAGVLGVGGGIDLAELGGARSKQTLNRTPETMDIVVGRSSGGADGSAAPFSKGFSFYTNEFGYSRDFPCQLALLWHPEQGLAMANELKAAVPGIAFKPQPVGIMNANIGATSTQGIASAVKAVALDPEMTNQFTLAGVFNDGVKARRGFPGETDYFAPLPG